MDKWQQDCAKFLQEKGDLQAYTGHGRMLGIPTQLLTDHRCYRAYLYKYNQDVDEACPVCHNEREIAEHIFFTYLRYVAQRNCLEGLPMPFEDSQTLARKAIKKTNLQIHRTLLK